MKRIKTIAMAAVVASMALNAAIAGDVIIVGGSMPSSSGMIGQADTGSTKLREAKRVDFAMSIVVGQSFTLSAADVLGGGYQFGEVFLQSHYAMDFDAMVPDFEIALYKGVAKTNVLIDTYSFDLASFGDGTVAADVAGGDWVRFSLDGGGTNLTEAGEYTFALFWADAGTSETWIWGARRTTGASDEFADGVQYYDPVFANSDWPVACTNLVEEVNRDLHFFVSEPLVGNSAPVADDQDVSTIEDSPLLITLSGSDLDGDDLTFAVQAQPTNGTLSGTAPDLTYTPGSGYAGSDSFTYTVNDGTFNSAVATVSIEVAPDLGILAGSVEITGTAASTGDVVIAQNITISGDSGTRAVKWLSGSIGFGVGQTFTATKNATASGIELKMSSSENFSNYDPASFKLKLFAGGVNSTTELGTYSFDATELGSGSSGEWLRFDFGANGVVLTNGSLYSFLVVNGISDSDHNMTFRRTKSTGDYADGNELLITNTDVENFDTDPWDTAAPVGSSVTDTSGHLIFSVVGGSTQSPYETWIALYELTGAQTNLTADLPDGDGVINLLEYALGGNPTIDDAVAILPASEADGDWLNYVYSRQNPADPALSYAVLSTLDLVSGPITNATEEAGASAAVNGFESVTNRVSTTTEGKQFMELKVQFAD